MSMRLNPYISFKDNAREAMEFYESVFGGKLMTSTFREFGMTEGVDNPDKVMHSTLEADNGIVLMASDTPNAADFKAGSNITISLSGDDEELLQGYFDKLSDGGEIGLPLEKAPWGDKFGMCADKFGVGWMVNIDLSKSA